MRVDCARRSFIFAGKDSEKAGLAHAVWTDNAEPFAFFNGEGQPAEDVGRAVGFGEAGGGNECHFSRQF